MNNNKIQRGVVYCTSKSLAISGERYYTVLKTYTLCNSPKNPDCDCSMYLIYSAFAYNYFKPSAFKGSCIMISR